MNELHLFSGAGGGILGGILLGHTCVCAVEIEPYCRKVLLSRQRDGILPRFPIWDDVRTFDGKPWRGLVDIVCGGFPCQDISAAGKGAGIDGERSGLWSEMARVIREVRPAFALVENSPMLTLRGLGRVLGDLAAMGYDARWGVVSAADAIWLEGTPCLDHLRERIWIVAIDRNASRARLERRERTIMPERAGQRIARTDDSPSADIARIQQKWEKQWAEWKRTWAGGQSHGDTDRTRWGPFSSVGNSSTVVDRLENKHFKRMPSLNETDATKWSHQSEAERIEKGQQVRLPTAVSPEGGHGGSLNPAWTEWLMNWPEGWTCVDPISHIEYAQWLMESSFNGEKDGNSEVLRVLRLGHVEEEIREASGGYGGLFETTVLFALLCKHKNRPHKARILLACAKVFKREMRGMRSQVATSSASHGSEHQKQRAEQHSDFMQALSRLLAHYRSSPWMGYRRETSAPRTAKNVGDRVHRLSSIGNGQMPTAAMLAWEILSDGETEG
jgi:DNA (cytosine-5)-methyltransferase 1